MPNAIVIGATSGIGRALAFELARNGYAVGITGRRRELLERLDKEIATPTYPKTMDIRNTAETIRELRELIGEMQGTDLVVINSGVLFRNANLDQAEAMIETNVTGFVAIAETAMEYFSTRKNGHLVGISSIAAIRGAKGAPVYNASKAFVSTYMDGLRHRVASKKLPIHITDVRPGFVETAMIATRRGRLFWVASPEKAARQIFDAIQQKKKMVYITKRWQILAWLARIVPDWLYHKW